MTQHAGLERRRLGRTGLEVPRVTLGAGWVGGLVISGAQSDRHDLLNGAIAAGVDWIDTAAMYGKGVSESMIGEWLAGIGPSDRPRISTKFSVDAAAPDVTGQMMRSIEASFGRLGVSRVPLVFLHNQVVESAEHRAGPSEVAASEVLRAGGVADAMERLREEGLCDWIGFTALGAPPAASELVRSGRFDVAQVYYNMINPTADIAAPKGWNSTDFGGILHACKRQDMGVMCIRILAAGHLATDRRHGREIPLTANAGDREEEARAAAALAALDGSEGTPAQLAMRFGLASDLLSTIVVGVGETWHLPHALDAMKLGPLSPAELSRLAAAWSRDRAFVG